MCFLALASFRLEKVRYVRVAVSILAAKGVIKHHFYWHIEFNFFRVRLNVSFVESCSRSDKDRNFRPFPGKVALSRRPTPCTSPIQASILPVECQT